MGAIVAKQPNGKICRISTISGEITAYDMTEDEYISHVEKCYGLEAKRNAERLVANNGFRSSDKILKDYPILISLYGDEIIDTLVEMGFDRKYIESLPKKFEE